MNVKFTPDNDFFYTKIFTHVYNIKNYYRQTLFICMSVRNEVK